MRSAKPGNHLKLIENYMKMAQEYINRQPCERQLLWLSQRKLNVKTVIGNSSNSSSHGECAKAARFYFATIKNNNFIKWCRRVIILMARIWIKRRLSIQKKIHGCSENSVSEEALFAVLDVKYIISVNISTHSAKPTFILRKSKGNSCSQTCMIFRTG